MRTTETFEGINHDRRRLWVRPRWVSLPRATFSLLSAKARAAAEGDVIRPFRVNVPEEQLVDLRRRIAATRWPDKETVTDESQGVQLATIKELAHYWATGHDWRKVEAVCGGGFAVLFRSYLSERVTPLETLGHRNIPKVLIFASLPVTKNFLIISVISKEANNNL